MIAKVMTIHRQVLLGLAVCLSAATAQADSAVWSLAGKRNTVYIAGSVHALPANDSALPATIERAYADAEVLVMELDMDDLDPAEAATFMLQRGTLPADRTLSQVLSPQQYQAAIKAGDELGLPAMAMDKLEPWVVTLLLTQAAIAKSGYDPLLGVDQQLATRAQADAKEILGLETLSEQLALFDDQSYEQQAKFLALSSDDVAAAKSSPHYSTAGAPANWMHWKRSCVVNSTVHRNSTGRYSASETPNGCLRFWRCAIARRTTLLSLAHCIW